MKRAQTNPYPKAKKKKLEKVYNRKEVKKVGH